MKAALYIRVSTQEQVENYSIGTQKERLEAYCLSKGWQIHDIYIDGGYSGSNIERPALTKLINDLPNLDVVVVYKLDRLSRSQRDTLTLIEDHFLKNNVDFVSLTETLDTSTPFGKAMIGILSVFAQLERETIAERMRMGHIKRAEEGYRVPGGNYDPAGYTRLNGELVVNEEEREHVKLTFDLYEQLRSITKVQKELKKRGFTIWRFRRYNDILKNKLYCGYVSFAGKYYIGRHEPLVSQEQFDRVQAIKETHQGANANKARESLLSGLITCGKCGERYLTYSTSKTVKNHGKIYRYYICRARRFPVEYDDKCLNHTWNSTKLEKTVIEATETYLKEKLFEQDKESPDIDYDKLIKRIDTKIERLLPLYLEDRFDKDTLDKQVDQLNDEKMKLINQASGQNTKNEWDPTKIKEMSIDLYATEFEKRQAVIQSLIEEILVTDKSIQVVWKD